MPTSVDLVGIGIGPSNLSLAALSTSLGKSRLFFDKKSCFNWHSGMLLPFAQLQVHYLKDCVTLVDPSNELSFLRFLSKNKRLYQFLNRHNPFVSRNEFNQYYQWVISQLDCLHFNAKVRQVSLKKQQFLIETHKDKVHTRNLILAIGQKPYYPKCALPFLSNRVFHANEYLTRIQDQTLTGCKILLVGGGQSGTEIIYHLLNTQVKTIYWASKRLNFHPIDNSCFSNEYYTPSYAHTFYNLSKKTRQSLIDQQLLSSDGISTELADQLYRRIYELKFIEKNETKIFLYPSSNLLSIASSEQSYYRAQLEHTMTGTSIECAVDMIIFATGYRFEYPDFLEPLRPYLNFESDHQLKLNFDYSIDARLDQGCKLFVQNAGRHSHGVADPNLSLTAWRSAMILNSIMSDTIYDPKPDHALFEKTYNSTYVQRNNIDNHSYETAEEYVHTAL